MLPSLLIIVSIIAVLFAIQFFNFHNAVLQGYLIPLHYPRWIANMFIRRFKSWMKKAIEEKRLWQMKELRNLVLFHNICKVRELESGLSPTNVKVVLEQCLLISFIIDCLDMRDAFVFVGWKDVWTEFSWYSALSIEAWPDGGGIRAFNDIEWKRLVPYLPTIRMEAPEEYENLIQACVWHARLDRLRDFFPSGAPEDYLTEMKHRVEPTAHNVVRLLEVLVILKDWEHIWRLCDKPGLEKQRPLMLAELHKAGRLQFLPHSVPNLTPPADSEPVS